MKEKLSILLEKLYRENYLEKEELKFILDNITYETAGPLFYYASKTRKKIYQDRVFLRALVEISNYCKNNCLYCGIRKDNRHVGRYRLLPEQIIIGPLSSRVVKIIFTLPEYWRQSSGR